MGAVPASSPLSSTTAAETAAGRLGRRTSAPPVLTVLRPESTVQAAHQPELPSFCESALDQQLITGYSVNPENYDTIRTMTCVLLTASYLIYRYVMTTYHPDDVPRLLLCATPFLDSAALVVGACALVPISYRTVAHRGVTPPT